MEGHADKIARRMEWAVSALDDLFALSPAPGTSSNSTSRRRNPNEEFSAIQ
jgi:hypothetical protein